MLKVNNFFFNALKRPFWVVLAGTGLAQALLFLTTPVLARFYNPESFGSLTVFSTTLGLMGAVMAGRYEYAISGELDDRDADALVALVVITAIAVGFFCSLAVFMVPGLIPAPYQGLLPFVVLAGAAYVISVAFNNWLIRQGMFVVATGLKVFRSLVMLVAAFMLIFHASGLVWSAASSYLLLALVALWVSIKRGWSFRRVSVARIWSVAKSRSKFPMQSALPAVFDNLSVLIPIYLGATLFGEEEVGQWGITRLMLAVPLGMVAVALSQILLKRLYDCIAENQSIGSVIGSVLLRTCIPVIILCIGISIFGEYIFPFVFGERWELAGRLSSWLVWAYSISALLSMLSVTCIVLQKLMLNGLWQVSHCLAIYFFFTSLSFSNFEEFIRWFVLIEIASYSVYGVFIFLIYRNHESYRRAKLK